MNMSQMPNQNQDETLLVVRRGRVESVDLYEIKDSELDLLEKGSPADLQLNFAIFLLSTAISMLVSLITSDFPSQTVHTSFILFTIIGFVGGAYLLFAWHGSHSSLKTICKRIRERIPPDIIRAIPDNANINTTVEVNVIDAEAMNLPVPPKG